ncbi:MAG: hypothetical protein MUD01_26400 [Chloroflexaceae bacterium]|jgi:hypothetical protein|nr:hypothetical protein [Chloroflexaceae bacterium]
MLLAVDNGLKCGLALYGPDGRLRWYRSHNFGSAARLKQGAPTILRETPELSWLVLEGGGALADTWLRAADRAKLQTMAIGAETWRERLLYAREQRSGLQAKGHADTLARRVISWSGLARPTALRHDAAEAILVGLWAVLELGWLAQLPPEIRRG